MPKVALITGGIRGLGKGFVDVLSQHGCVVYTGSPSTEEHQSESVVYLNLDVTDDGSINSTIQRIKDDHGHIDLLINNAGLNKDTATGGHMELASKLQSVSREVMQTMFDVNATGPLMLIKQAVPIMSRDNAFIINVSSVRASFKDKGTHANYGYRASKVALNMFTQSLTHDLPNNISIFAVHPGSVHTDMNPNGELEPHDAAGRILNIMDSWKPENHGAFLKNDGTLHPL